MKRVLVLLLVCFFLSGCKILSSGQVTALQNAATILEGGEKSNGATARILEKTAGTDPQVIRIVKDGAKREGTVAKSIRAIVGGGKEGESNE